MGSGLLPGQIKADEREAIMKAIVCEMCSGHDVVKDGDFYVCRNCGTKYTPESARKLMTEIEGTVRIDHSDTLANYLKLARQAASEGNVENAANYYEMAKTLDGNNWESYFYSAYYRAANGKLIELVTQANNVSNCIPTAIKLVKTGVDAGTQKAVCDQIANAVRKLRIAFVNTATSHYLKFPTVDGASSDRNSRCAASYGREYAAGVAIYEAFGFKDTAIGLLKDCTATESHLDMIKVSKALSMIDPEAGQQNVNKHAKKAVGYSIAYLVFAAVFAAGAIILGKMGEAFNVVKWVCIGAAAVFGLIGLAGVISGKAVKKGYEDGKY